MAAPRVAIIGGGLAGLAAAQELLRAGVACTLLDMGGRGVGGRVASRQLPFGKQALPLSFDDGAQYFHASSPAFRAELAGWAAAGVAAEWRGKQGRITADGAFVPSLAESDGASSGGAASSSDSGSSDAVDDGVFAAASGQARWVGVPTNAAIPHHMAASLLAQHGAEPGQGSARFQLLRAAVTSMEQVGGGGGGGDGMRWRLQGSLIDEPDAAAAPPEQAQQGGADFGTFDAAILADAGPLLPGGRGRVEGLEACSPLLADLARSVQGVAAAAQPRLALMAAFAQPLQGVPFDFATLEHAADGGAARNCEGCGCGACGSGFGGALHLVACNSSKPGRPGAGAAGGGGSGADAPQCWVAMTTGQRAVALVEQYGSVHSVHSQAFREAVASELLADFRDALAPFVKGYFVPAPDFMEVKWWGRAFVTQPLGAEFVLLPAERLALCGDATIGSGVENAWRSGRAAGAAVGRMLRSG